ncbi:helix-hairpin-helix domain-containing protein [Candidatus Villigracilis affinis]|uniref:ComEA family DNA-binding protein n=1 Tax=Candidatus Villigracilis affinis TaxID=3140682 RepID=UPI001D9322C4|nr:helix-hairpin-helix domain-containing protein [Anaerolineales bacterium]
MSDFLNYLNTADLDTLTKTPGITRPIAGGIIAGRPFDSVDDCLKVRGMGKNLLTRLQSTFEGEENVSESRAMVTVEEEPKPAPIERHQPAQESAREEEPSFLTRLGRALLVFFRALMQLIALAIIIAGIGAAFYYGLPFINQNVIVPIEQNTTGIRELRDEIEILQTELNEMNARVDAVEKTIETQSASIARLEEMQKTLEEEITTQNNSVMVALKREVMYTRAIETISRARLYLSQSNFGLAKTDVQSARDLLAELLMDAPTYQVDAFNQILMRLDLALGNLPAFPVIAADDVDIAWQLMMMGLPESEAEIVPTSTPLPPPTFTPTTVLEPSATFTPTPAPVLEITPTPTAIP